MLRFEGEMTCLFCVVSFVCIARVICPALEVCRHKRVSDLANSAMLTGLSSWAARFTALRNAATSSWECSQPAVGQVAHSARLGDCASLRSAQVSLALPFSKKADWDSRELLSPGSVYQDEEMPASIMNRKCTSN